MRRGRSLGEPARRKVRPPGYGLAAVRPGLTRDAERLIECHVDSVGTLDLLLLLRSRPTRAWTAAELCAELRCPPEWARAELQRLHAGGLAASDGDVYRYAPASPREQAAVDSVAGVWRRDRAVVTRLILAPRRARFEIRRAAEGSPANRSPSPRRSSGETRRDTVRDEQA